jgi:hypothetical protein
MTRNCTGTTTIESLAPQPLFFNTTNHRHVHSSLAGKSGQNAPFLDLPADLFGVSTAATSAKFNTTALAETSSVNSVHPQDLFLGAPAAGLDLAVNASATTTPNAPNATMNLPLDAFSEALVTDTTSSLATDNLELLNLPLDLFGAETGMPVLSSQPKLESLTAQATATRAPETMTFALSGVPAVDNGAQLLQPVQPAAVFSESAFVDTSVPANILPGNRLRDEEARRKANKESTMTIDEKVAFLKTDPWSETKTPSDIVSADNSSTSETAATTNTAALPASVSLDPFGGMPTIDPSLSKSNYNLGNPILQVNSTLSFVSLR